MVKFSFVVLSILDSKELKSYQSILNKQFMFEL